MGRSRLAGDTAAAPAGSHVASEESRTFRRARLGRHARTDFRHRYKSPGERMDVRRPAVKRARCVLSEPQSVRILVRADARQRRLQLSPGS